MKRFSGLSRDSINFMSVSADIMKTNSLVLAFETSNEPSDFSVCQVYYSPKKKFLLLPASKVSTYKVKELIELVASTVGSTDGNLAVMIKSPSNFSLLLQDDDCPFSFMDALFFLPIDDSAKSESQRYYLQVFPKSENKQTHAFVPVIDDKAQLLYMAPLSFNTDQYKLKYIISFLAKLHSCSTDAFTVYNKKGVIIKEFEAEKDFIRALIFNSLYISFKPGDALKKEISKRVMVLSEFRDTEARYYKTLEGFEENVGNVFKKTNFLTKEESEAFMTSSHYIITLHEQINKEFQNMRIDYMTLIGQWFKKYVPFLKVYHQYVALYKSYLPKITSALHSKQYASVFKDFTNSDYANGLVFDSVLIIPVQRGPRYQLLLREVLKNTPETHPDFTVLSEALELTKDTLKRLEQDVSLVERRQKMEQLENWFADKVSIFQPNRLYINTFFLFIKKQKITFILFSDEFWVAKVIEEKLTLDKTYKYSEVDIIKYAKQSVVLRSTELDRICFMENPDNRDLLISQFRETASCYIQRQRNQIQLQFESVSQDKTLDLADHQMAILNDSLYIFGGRDFKGTPSGTLYRYSSNGTNLLETIEYKEGSSPCPRYMFGFTAIKTGLFVYGGTTNGKDELDDLWFFSFKSSRWGQIPGKGDIPPPGYGLDLKAIDGSTLLLSGGKNECGFYRLTLRDKDKEKEKVWEQVQLKRGTEIMSLYGHSLVPLERAPAGSAIIIGGKNSEGVYNDFPIHVTKYGEVISFIRLNLINPTSRFLHRCVEIGDLLYCFGGHGDQELTTFLLQLSLSSWTVPQIEGAKFAAIGSFAIAVDGETIYLHGGVNKDGKVIGNLLKVTTKLSPEDNPEAMMFLNMNNLSFEKDSFVTNMIQNPKSVTDE